MKHLPRIISAIVVTAGFIIAVTKITSPLGTLITVLIYLGLCWVIIAIDKAKEMPDDYE
jgi:ABC-type xylose transport system permease subunit